MVLLNGRIVFNNPMQQMPVENGLHGYIGLIPEFILLKKL